MSKSESPWSVKGVENHYRALAKDSAAQNGQTMGEWLSQAITDSVSNDNAEADTAQAGGDEQEILSAMDQYLKNAIQNIHQRSVQLGKEIEMVERRLELAYDKMQQQLVKSSTPSIDSMDSGLDDMNLELTTTSAGSLVMPEDLPTYSLINEELPEDDMQKPGKRSSAFLISFAVALCFAWLGFLLAQTEDLDLEKIWPF